MTYAEALEMVLAFALQNATNIEHERKRTKLLAAIAKTEKLLIRVRNN